jgi:hypothetical protein
LKKQEKKRKIDYIKYHKEYRKSTVEKRKNYGKILSYEKEADE